MTAVRLNSSSILGFLVIFTNAPWNYNGGRRNNSALLVVECLAIPIPPLAKTIEHLPLAQKAMEYFDASSDPFHAVQSSINILQQAGFQEWIQDHSSSSNDEDNNVSEGNDDEQKGSTPTTTTATSATTKLKQGGLYYFTKNKSTLVAFRVGRHYKAGNGFTIIGGHTDSPNLRIKPRSKRTSAGGNVIQIGVECYGGGLWHTWFDRDLGISGRVFVRKTQPAANDSSSSADAAIRIEQRLVKIDRAVLRIPNLAIHLQTAKERDAFEVNKEDHLSPILAMAVKKALTGESGEKSTSAATGTTSPAESKDDTEEGRKNDDESNNKNNKKSEATSTTTRIPPPKEDGWTEYQEPVLLQLLAAELNVEPADIVDFELSLFDTQKASLGGSFSEFIHSARLDNLASCFLAVQALVDHVQQQSSSSQHSLPNQENKDSGATTNEEEERQKQDATICQADADTDIAMIVLYDHEEVGSGSAIGAASPILQEAIDRITTAFASSSSVTAVEQINRFYASSIRKSFVISSDQAHAVHPNYVNKHEKMHQPVMNGGMVIKRNTNQRYATTVLTGVIIREIARQAKLPPVQEFMVRQDCGCGSTIGPQISQVTGIRTIDMGCPQLSMHSIRETMGVCDLTNGLALFKAFFQRFTTVDASIQQ